MVVVLAYLFALMRNYIAGRPHIYHMFSRLETIWGGRCDHYVASLGGGSSVHLGFSVAYGFSYVGLHRPFFFFGVGIMLNVVMWAIVVVSAASLSTGRITKHKKDGLIPPLPKLKIIHHVTILIVPVCSRIKPDGPWPNHFFKSDDSRRSEDLIIPFNDKYSQHLDETH